MATTPYDKSLIRFWIANTSGGVVSAIMFIYLLTIIAILISLHLLLTNTEKIKLIRKLPLPEEHFILGNALCILKSPVELFDVARVWAKQFPGIYGFWSFMITAVNIYNPKDIETILATNKHNEKSIIYGYLKPWLGEGLLLSSGSKWQQRRKILTTAFHFSILREFCTTIEENSQRLVEALEKTNGEQVDIVPVLSEYTLSSICETAMGTKLHDKSSGTKSYKQAIHSLGGIVLERISKIYYVSDLIFNLSLKGRAVKKHLQNLHGFTTSVIKERKEFVKKNGITIIETEDDVYLSSRKKKIAMLDLLIAADQDGTIDSAGVQEEVDTFMFEGHDTTASGLNYCLMLIANHKEIQDKIYTEVKQVFGESDRLATIDDLNSMRYLDRCIKESLRLYPPVPFIGRVLKENVTLSNFVIPENTNCHIHIYDLHRREDLFKNAEKFDPDRFLPENCADRHPFAYIPFSAGPRNCIGQRFATLEMKSCVSALLRRFELEPVTTPSDVQIMGDLVLRNNKPIYVKFIKRVK